VPGLGHVGPFLLGGVQSFLRNGHHRRWLEDNPKALARRCKLSMTLSGAVAAVMLRKLVPKKMFILGVVTLAIGVLITLAGVQYQNVGVMLFGTLVGGIGFGTVFSGTLRSVLPSTRRTRWPAVRLFGRGLSFLQPSCACGRLPRTRRRFDADRRYLRHRRHIAGHHFARHHALAGPARVVTRA
jgi:hypothetical protein